MNSHNTTPEFSFYKTPALDKDDIREAKIIGARLSNDSDLSIVDDLDAGCDPYNATGHHVMLMQKDRSPKK